MANEEETSRWVDDQLMNLLGYNTPETVAFVIKLAKKTRTLTDLITELQAIEFPASQETETFARELLMRLPQKKNAGIIAARERAREQDRWEKAQLEERLREKEAARKRAREQDQQEMEELEERLREKEAARERARQQDQQEKEELEERLRENEAARERAREQERWEEEELEESHRAKDAASTKKVDAHLVKTEQVAGTNTRGKKKRKLGPVMPLSQPKSELDELDEARVPPQGQVKPEMDEQPALNDTEGGHDPAMASTSPQLGCTYTRHEIHMMLGGGEQTFLPTKNGRVCCGCYTFEFNPLAPTQVLVGPGPMRKSSAEMAVQQGGSLPIFMKQAPHTWEYVGEYRATRWVDLDQEAGIRAVREAREAGGHRVKAVVGILYMEKA